MIIAIVSLVACTKTSDYGETKVPMPEAVDLGLSVKWASFNIGASAPEEYGFYYAWGEKELKSDYSWSTYKWCNGDMKKLTKYCDWLYPDYWDGEGSPDGKEVLNLVDDVARIKLAGKWRMPKVNEWLELRDGCIWMWTTQNGVNGMRVTGKNGNSIFLPAAGIRIGTNIDDAGVGGYYWTSEWTSGLLSLPYAACSMDFNPNYTSNYNPGYYSVAERFCGLSVRAVSE